ncbi:DUF4956 domain-containing protein [Teredinibacter franksiae]|jgi:hypothetical protein|uniref:DUF4956 domain-containing protein n=1 Tax=Teredinibacter franksiae TaxID=2761453 RepID=UPI0016241317|nr:DUF4956 domain-containing protein [Teredinibacter franksiae]
MQALLNQLVEYSDFAYAMALSGILPIIVGMVYKKYGSSVSNRTVFARNFLIITMSTTLIIIVVKSSIALSLGLVGALSIVRFRAAIKEPEEIAYLFFIIAIGIGLGAFQFVIILVAIPFIIGLIILRAHIGGKVNKTTPMGNYNINVISKLAKTAGVGPISNIVKEHTTKAELKHYSEDEQSTSMLFFADISSLEKLDGFRKLLVEYEPGIAIDVVANREIS